MSPAPLSPKDSRDALGSWQLSVVCVYLVGHRHCASKRGNYDLERGRGPPRLHVSLVAVTGICRGPYRLTGWGCWETLLPVKTRTQGGKPCAETISEGLVGQKSCCSCRRGKVPPWGRAALSPPVRLVVLAVPPWPWSIAIRWCLGLSIRPPGLGLLSPSVARREINASTLWFHQWCCHLGLWVQV